MRICPYCKSDSGKEIKRKVSCSNCGEQIYVRNGIAVTEREKEIIDWQKYMEFLVPDIEKIRKDVESELTKRFGQPPSAHDLVWGMFNFIVTKLREPKDLSILYLNMATFLEKEGKHEQAKKCKRESTKMELLEWNKSEWTNSVMVENCNDDFVCKECKSKHHKKMSIQEAIENIPVPVEECSNKNCRCRLRYVSKFEEMEDHNELDNNITITVNSKIKKKGLLDRILEKWLPS